MWFYYDHQDAVLAILFFISSIASSRCFSLSKSTIKSHLGNSLSLSFVKSNPVSSPLPARMIPVALLDSTMRCVRGRRTSS